MRLIRIHLRNFRGVVDRDIPFARDGVTILEGPNEIGKSTVAEAIDLLFGELDTANSKKVNAVKPVHRDAGPEVELEVETGPYAFTYRKRFVRDKLTELRITRPRPENLSGRDAHQRVLQILAETVDDALWKALRIVQGDAVGSTALSGSQSLAEALDRAAGTVPVGPVETTLFDRAHDEYLLYWTEGGRSKGQGALETAVTEAGNALALVDDAIRRVEQDVADVARLDGELAALRVRRAGEQARLEDLAGRWKRVEGMVDELKAAEMREQAARLEFERANSAVVERRRLKDVLVAATAERERRRQEAAQAAPDLERARERAAAAATALVAATQGREAADAMARLFRADAAYLRDHEALTGLIEQAERVRLGRQALAEARAAVAANPVDDRVVEGIRAADTALRVAVAAREAGSPRVELQALVALEVRVGEELVRLASGDTVARPVPERLHLEVPGTLAITIDRGAGGADGARAVATAETALRTACRAAGVADLAEAVARAAARRLDENRAREAERTIAEILGSDDDAAATRLEERIAVARGHVEGYLRDRSATPAIAADEAKARAAAAEADGVVEAAMLDVRRTTVEDNLARTGLAELERTAATGGVHLDLAEQSFTAAETAVATARAGIADDLLDAADTTAAATFNDAVAAATGVRARFAAERPEETRALYENAQAVMDGSAAAQRDLEDRLLEVRTRLVEHGEDGLAEKRDDAVTRHDAATRELDAYAARAAARKALFDALRAARETARLEYIGPLRQRIEEIGRFVFGESLAVQLSEDLKITHRTLDGKTLPFESLSVGAREQLGVITRLACAMIVAPDGGVPVILDDTLGYSDPERLKAMGAVLALAGRSCQVIVMTCYPERYSEVGGATTFRLA